MNENAGPFAGLDRKRARTAVKKALDEKGLAKGSKPHILNIPKCQRSGGVVALVQDHFPEPIQPATSAEDLPIEHDDHPLSGADGPFSARKSERTKVVLREAAFDPSLAALVEGRERQPPVLVAQEREPIYALRVVAHGFDPVVGGGSHDAKPLTSAAVHDVDRRDPLSIETGGQSFRLAVDLDEER